jgi:hypothetical protein
MESELEQVLISSYKDKMISFLHSHPECFKEAIELALADKQPFSWRAAWLLWSCLEENDRRLHIYIKRIINNITTKQDGHQRELLKILLIMDLNEEHEGLLFNVCVDIWESINKRPSVRFTAFKVILKIAKKYPEIAKEISFLTQNHLMESLSPGVKRSISRMIKEFEQI